MITRRNLINALPYPIARAARIAINGTRNLHKLVSPNERHRARKIRKSRNTAEVFFKELAQSSPHRFKGTVLIDGSWINPNFWWRLTLARRALGTAHTHEVGYLGKFQRQISSETFQAIGVDQVVRHDDYFPDHHRQAIQQATALISNAQSSDDVLNWELPYGYPAACAYDGILKHQKSAEVDLKDPDLVKYTTQLLLSLEASSQLLDEVKPQILLLSSAINFESGTLAWIASQRNIEVVVIYGCFGVPRFWKVTPDNGIFKPLDTITADEMDALVPETQDRLARVGRSYMQSRLSGQTQDHGAIYAFGVSNVRVSREGLCQEYGWDPQKPIVSVYASNWFDFPKSFGATQFRDFLDFIKATLDKASDTTSVNWLFRPHPCDEWYGGVTLKDLVKADGLDHVKLTPKRWKGDDVMRLSDAVVTMHGTAAIEYASLGKPVLIADQGWYHKAGFAKWVETREAYLNNLSMPWWEGLDLDERKKRSEIFAGWFFCHPDWQQDLLVDDDFRNQELWSQFPNLVDGKMDILERECQSIRDWINSDQPHYHSFKMKSTTAYAK